MHATSGGAEMSSCLRTLNTQNSRNNSEFGYNSVEDAVANV
jgi:hypothetical protein